MPIIAGMMKCVYIFFLLMMRIRIIFTKPIGMIA